MEKRESDLPGRYDLHYAGTGDTKERRERERERERFAPFISEAISGVFGPATIMSPRPTLSRRAALCCATVPSCNFDRANATDRVRT